MIVELPRELNDLVAGIIDLLSNNSDRLSARLSAEQIDDVIQRYEAGESARTLAADSGVAPSALLRLLRERNVVVRRQVVTPDQEKTMAQDYAAGMTMAELETERGLSHGAVLRGRYIELESRCVRSLHGRDPTEPLLRGPIRRNSLRVSSFLTLDGVQS